MSDTKDKLQKQSKSMLDMLDLLNGKTNGD